MSHNSVPESELSHLLTCGKPTPKMLIDMRHAREVSAWLTAAEQPQMKEGVRQDAGSRTTSLGSLIA